MGALTVAPPNPTNSYNLISILNQAYRLSGALANPGMGIAPSEQNEALFCLNAMIDGFKLEQLMIVLYLRTYQTVNTNQQNYSVGPNGDFNIERPEKIHAAGYILQGQTPQEAEIPMQVLLSYEQYAAFVAKNVGSAIPLCLYYQATLNTVSGAGPWGTATLWPIPSESSQIVLYTQSTLEEYLTIDDPVIVPAGYREMLMYNLAVRIHQRYPDKLMDGSVMEMASEYKQRVKNQQLMPVFVQSDNAVLDKRGQWLGGLPKAYVPYGP